MLNLLGKVRYRGDIIDITNFTSTINASLVLSWGMLLSDEQDGKHLDFTILCGDDIEE